MAFAVNFDEVFTSLGSYGKWQMMHLIGASLSWIHSACGTLFILIAGYVPDHMCQLPSALNGSEIANYGSCGLWNISSNVTLTCKWGYRYNITNAFASIVSEWNLVCNKDYISWLSQTLYAFGQVIGALTFTNISDKYGRKRCYIISHLVFITLDIAGSFVPDFYWFFTVRFFTGLFQTGTMTIVFVYIVEMFPLKKNYAVTIFFNVMVSFGFCFLALLGYLMQNVSWRYIQLTIGCLFLPMAYQIWFFDESVRWLWTNNKKESVLQILKKAAKINGVRYEDVERHLQNDIEISYDITKDCAKINESQFDIYKPEANKGQINISFTVIAKNSYLMRHFILLLFIWPSQYLTLYGIQFMANELSGNRFLNIFLYGVVEIPSKLTLMILSKRMGRKLTYISMMIPCSLSLLTATVLSTPNIDFQEISTALIILSKFFVGASLSVVWMYTPELYPTNFRSSGVGYASAFARIACMAAPFSGYIASYTKWIPGAIFSVVGFVSCVLIMLLPETKNKPLIQNIEDVQTLYQANKNDDNQYT